MSVLFPDSWEAPTGNPVPDGFIILSHPGTVLAAVIGWKSIILLKTIDRKVEKVDVFAESQKTYRHRIRVP